LNTDIVTMELSGSHSSLDEFLSNFQLYCELYRRLETLDETTVPDDTLSVGEKLGLGSKSWTKRDLEDLLRRKHLHHFFPKIGVTPNLDKQLIDAFKVQEEKARIEALCEIPGIGPVLASVVLESMSPETYGALSSHAWSALRLLGFNLPKKRASHDNFTVHELLRYLEIVGRLARERDTKPTHMAKALYAFDKAVTDNRWKRQFILILRRFTTPVLSAYAKGQFTDATPTSNSRTLSSPI
jgi:hypothetical protein